MLKITGLGLVEEIAEHNNRIKKANAEIKKQKVKELMAQGVDKELAKVMADAYMSCGL